MPASYALHAAGKLLEKKQSPLPNPHLSCMHPAHRGALSWASCSRATPGKRATECWLEFSSLDDLWFRPAIAVIVRARGGGAHASRRGQNSRSRLCKAANSAARESRG